MTFKFTPASVSAAEIKVPYFEDARADVAPYANSERPIKAIQEEITGLLRKLEATNIQFQEGTFEDGKLKRHGYLVDFVYAGNPGRVEVAGLPIRYTPTSLKVDRVKAQALLIARDWIKQMATSKIFLPHSEPLLPYLLADGNKTVAEIIVETGFLPVPPPRRALPNEIKVEKP
jgi:hypothetical protein